MIKYLAIFLISIPVLAQDHLSQWVAKPDEHPYNQVFSLQAGVFRPTSISLANSQNQFDYVGRSLDSYVVEPGWAFKIFHLLGSVYLNESLFLSSFRGTVPQQSDALFLMMIGLDMRVRHAWEWFPVKFIIPFVEGGYQYTFYSQTGPSDFEAANGLVGNFVAGAGMDIWINNIFSSQSGFLKNSSTPVFLTAKVNQIISRSSNVNLGSTTFLAGISVGI